MNIMIKLRMWCAAFGFLLMLGSAGCVEELPMSNADLNNVYITASFYVNTGAPTVCLTETSFNGAGNLLVKTNAENITGSYTLAADGKISIDNHNSNEAMVGQLSPDKNLFSLADTNKTDGVLGFTVGIKRPTGMDESKFSGTYSGICLESMIGDTNRIHVSMSEIHADGQGNLLNDDGGIYTVSDTGILTAYNSDNEIYDENLHCQLSQDGEQLLIVVDGVNQKSISIYTRQPTGMKTRNILGTYGFVGFESKNPLNTSYEIGRGTMSSNGSGVIKMNIEAYSKDFPVTEFDAEISVENNGAFTISDSNIQGQLDATGQLLFHGNYKDDRASILIGIRKPFFATMF